MKIFIFWYVWFESHSLGLQLVYDYNGLYSPWISRIDIDRLKSGQAINRGGSLAETHKNSIWCSRDERDNHQHGTQPNEGLSQHSFCSSSQARGTWIWWNHKMGGLKVSRTRWMGGLKFKRKTIQKEGNILDYEKIG